MTTVTFTLKSINYLIAENFLETFSDFITIKSDGVSNIYVLDGHLRIIKVV